MRAIIGLLLGITISLNVYGQWKYECDIKTAEYESCLAKIDSTHVLDFWDSLAICPLIAQDTVCHCVGINRALKDSLIKLMVIGDPGHVSQYIYHKYAERGIQLIMTGDMVAIGQKKFNEGYNSVSVRKIKSLYPKWDLYRPFKKRYSKKGLNNFELYEQLQPKINAQHSGDSIFIQLENHRLLRHMENCSFWIYSNYHNYINKPYSLTDLKKGINIDISELSLEEIDDLEIAIDLNSFSHWRYNWYLTERRNWIYLDI